MGTINHDVVIITSSDTKVQPLIDFIKGLDLEQQKFFTISPVMTNGTITVVMFPDGSKEGWETSNECDELRNRFISIAGRLEWTDIIHCSYGDYGFKVNTNTDQGIPGAVHPMVVDTQFIDAVMVTKNLTTPPQVLALPMEETNDK